MGVAVGVPVDVSGNWWGNPSAVATIALRRHCGAELASFRLGDVVLDVDSTYPGLLGELRSTYQDCLVNVDATQDEVRVRCLARLIENSLLVLQIQGFESSRNLCDVGCCLTHPRVELQHFFARELDQCGWKQIANARDEHRPLMVANTNTAIIDLQLEPHEFVVNLLVGLAQLAHQSVIFLHAGGVSIDGRGTLLVGRSGKGKSTTTVALASRGHGLLGDETVGVRVDFPEIVAFQRTLKLRPGATSVAITERLKSVSHYKRPDARGTECTWVSSRALFSEIEPVLSAPLCNVFFLRGFSTHASVEPFTPSLAHLDELQALPMSLSAIVSWPMSAAHRLVRFLRVIDLLAKCRCYFLDLGTPDQTAVSIERIVRDHAA
jgi:hypothetical protein